MDSIQSTESEKRLLSQAVALVKQAMGGTNEPRIVDAILDACRFLEASSYSETSIVALEQDIHLETGTYHLLIRRLNSSVPVGKFQILLTRDLASGLIY